MWHVGSRSLTRDQTPGPRHWKRGVSATGSPQAGIISPILQVMMLTLRGVARVSSKGVAMWQSCLTPRLVHPLLNLFTQFSGKEAEQQGCGKGGTDTKLLFGESCCYWENFPQLGPQTRVLCWPVPWGYHMKVRILAWWESVAGQKYSTIFLCTWTSWLWLTLAHRSEIHEALAFLFSGG